MTFRLATGSASSGGALEPASTSTSLVRSTHITHTRKTLGGREEEKGAGEGQLNQAGNNNSISACS
jgi:hypothetical protein